MSLTQTTLSAFSAIVGPESVLVKAEDLIPYSFDGTAALKERPEAVIFPRTADQVAGCVRLASVARIPIVTRGSGTGLSGGSVPTPGSLVLCLAQMDAILDVDPRNLTLRAEPGTITQRIDEAAGRYGLFYPPDPGSMRISTIGGNVAENSGGLRGLKYGVTKDYVQAIEAVLPTGEFVRLGGKAVKDVAGYGLKDLMVGSEGTLAIFTRILVRLVPRPRVTRTILATFDTIGAAGEAVAAILAQRIVPSMLEFLDATTIRAVERFARLGLPQNLAALLLIEADGHPVVVDEEAHAIARLCKAGGAREVRHAATAAEAEDLRT
ncbi:MAG: FAD-binding oxidoreductase, partial [bacterium]